MMEKYCSEQEVLSEESLFTSSISLVPLFIWLHSLAGYFDTVFLLLLFSLRVSLDFTSEKSGLSATQWKRTWK